MIATFSDTTVVNTFLQLPEQIKEQIYNYMQFLIAQYHINLQQNTLPQPETQQKQRILGGLEGKIWIADDFNEPLEDFKEYM